MAKNVGPTKLCSETIRVIDAENADRKPVTLAIDGDRQLLGMDFLLIEPDAELAYDLAQRVTSGYNGNERIAVGHGSPECARFQGAATGTWFRAQRTA